MSLLVLGGFTGVEERKKRVELPSSIPQPEEKLKNFLYR